MYIFAILPQSPPWNFVGLLSESQQRRDETLATMRLDWELILILESSTVPAERSFATTLNFKSWIVVREVMSMYESEQWRHHKRGEQYVKSLFPGLSHSILLELGFNDARDNEVRGARHKQRSETHLQARLDFH
jgi:hypothetical protein